MLLLWLRTAIVEVLSGGTLGFDVERSENASSGLNGNYSVALDSQMCSSVLLKNRWSYCLTFENKEKERLFNELERHHVATRLESFFRAIAPTFLLRALLLFLTSTYSHAMRILISRMSLLVFRRHVSNRQVYIWGQGVLTPFLFQLSSLIKIAHTQEASCADLILILSMRIFVGSVFRRWKFMLVHSLFTECCLWIVAIRYCPASAISSIVDASLQSTLIVMGLVYLLERENRFNFLLKFRLFQSELQWRSVLERCPDALVIQTCDGVAFANTPALKLANLDQAQIDSCSQDFKHVSPTNVQLNADLRDRLAPLVESSCKPLLSRETEILPSSGLDVNCSSSSSDEEEDAVTKAAKPSRRSLEITGSAVSWWGEPAALLFLRDVTERKQREAAVHASKAKGALLAMVSHEFRTPLNGIMGMLQILLDRTQQTDEGLKYLKHAFTSSKLLLNLVNDMLDFSMIEVNKFRLCPTAYVLPDCLRQVVDIFAVEAKDREIELSLHIDSTVPTVVFSDRRRLQQIFLNLLSNAFKFTQKGFIRCDATCESSGGGGESSFKVTVTDSGAGIRSENLNKLFSPFEKLADTAKLNQSGTGLGLTICKQLCEQMGGDIHVRSEHGVGSTFVFSVKMEIPLATTELGDLCIERRPSPAVSDSPSHSSSDTHTLCPENEKEDTSSAAAAACSSEATDSKQLRHRRPASGKTTSLRILLVEDNHINSRIIQHMLKKAGHVVTVVVDGLLAVEAVRKGEFDGVLMDCNMPIMDGFEATQRIKQLSQSRHQNLPVIGLTGLTSPEDKNRCLQVGMDYCLSKPVVQEQLFAALSLIRSPERSPRFI